MALALSDVPCKAPTLYDFTVYSVGDISVQRSDYQGLTGTAGNLTASHFQFNSNPETCLALTTGQGTTIESSATNGNIESQGRTGLTFVGVHGNVSAKNLYLNSSHVSGHVFTPSLKNIYSGLSGRRYKTAPFHAEHSAIVAELLSESAKLAALPSNGFAKYHGIELVIQLKPGSNVIALQNSEVLNKVQKIYIVGDAMASVIVNIPGDVFKLKYQKVILDNNILPGNIIWNFHQARSLHLSHTHDPIYGMPGVVMAPYAQVEFHEALITGALYAGSIVTSTMLPTELNAGQVNRAVGGHREPLPIPPHVPPPVYPD